MLEKMVVTASRFIEDRKDALRCI